jgi:N-acetylneuraminic acid mutarotase
MKTTFPLAVVFLLSAGLASVAVAQIPAVTHNTWSSGAPIPTAVFGPTTAVLIGPATAAVQIYLVGGCSDLGPENITQVYNPTTNTWSSGVMFPTTVNQAGAAVVKGILYVIGGSYTGSITQTNEVFAFSPKTNSWIQKTSMNEERESPGIAVENGIIYAIGGYNTANGFLSSVESYNPASDTWTEEAPLLVGESAVSAGRIGTAIVIADGTEYALDASDTESYDALAKQWTSLKADPMPRYDTCGAAVGKKLYVAGGDNIQSAGVSITESFNPSTNKWANLAAMPQAAFIQGTAEYKGKLYCFGGWAQGTVLNNVQIYQP